MPLRNVLQVPAVVVALFLAAPSGAAESGGGGDPSDPKAPAPPIEYRSVFSSYQSLIEAERKPWRTANDDAVGMGGHAGHAMPGATKPSEPAPDTEKPSANREKSGGGHRGH